MYKKIYIDTTCPRKVFDLSTLYNLMHFREPYVFCAIVACPLATRVDSATRMLPVEQCGFVAQSHV